jgi:hypothetical protein
MGKKKEENWKGKERKEKEGTIKYICLGKVDRDEKNNKKIIIINRKNWEKGGKNRQKDKTGAPWGKKNRDEKQNKEKNQKELRKRRKKKDEKHPPCKKNNKNKKKQKDLRKKNCFLPFFLPSVLNMRACTSICEGRWFVLFCSYEIHGTWMFHILFLVSLESSQWWVHGLGSMMFGLVVQKFLNIEWFFHWKLN